MHWGCRADRLFGHLGWGGAAGLSQWRFVRLIIEIATELTSTQSERVFCEKCSIRALVGWLDGATMRQRSIRDGKMDFLFECYLNAI